LHKTELGLTYLIEINTQKESAKTPQNAHIELMIFKNQNSKPLFKNQTLEMSEFFFTCAKDFVNIQDVKMK